MVEERFHVLADDPGLYSGPDISVGATKPEEPADLSTDDGWEWALVEIMGYKKLYGRIREEERFGTKMMRIDVPIYVGKQEGEGYPRKIVDLRLDRWETHYHPGSALHGFRLSDEATVMKLAESEAKIDRPARVMLPAPDAPTSRHDVYDAEPADEEDDEDF